MSELISKDHTINRILHYLGKFEGGLSAASLTSKMKLKAGTDLESRLSFLVEKGLIQRIDSGRVYNGVGVKVYRRIK